MEFLDWCFNQHKYLAAILFPAGAWAWAIYHGMTARVVLLTLYLWPLVILSILGTAASIVTKIASWLRD